MPRFSVQRDKITNPEHYATGILKLDGKTFCLTLEPGPNRFPHPIIPAGVYPVILAKFGHVYASMCDMLTKRAASAADKATAQSFVENGAPLLQNVPGRGSIMIHIGNSEKDSEGCTLLGSTANGNTIAGSTLAYFRFYPVLLAYIKSDPHPVIEYLDPL